MESYTAKDIEILEGLSAIRKNPGMYIGSTDSAGLHKMVFEVVDNSLDEALAGYCNNIKVIIRKDNDLEIVEVDDNGRGIPVDIHPEKNKSALEIIMTTLHAGGKFSNKNYAISGGLHGVGVSVVNALSAYCEVYSYRNGNVYYQKYIKGEPVEEVKIIGKENRKGTRVIFAPDKEIFKVNINFDLLSGRLRELAFLNKNVTISIKDERDHKKIKEKTFKFDSLAAFIDELNHGKKTFPKKPIYISSKEPKIEMELVIQYTDDNREIFFAYANNIRNDEGGVHVSGFRWGLTRAINEILKSYNKSNKKIEAFTGDDVREGLTGVLSLRVVNPQFKNQTKDKLTGSEEEDINIEQFVRQSTYDELLKYLERNPDDAKQIIERCILAYKSREAADRARQNVRKKAELAINYGMPEKLADASEKDPAKKELFIVEGDSAGGSAKQGRNREIQAVLPIRGKVSNVEKLFTTKGKEFVENKILESETIMPLLQAIGTNIGKDFNIEKLRYHKIIIMADADIDGSHIISLLLTLFYRYMPELIKKGHLYIAMPPLYKIQWNKKVYYVYSDEEKDKILDQIGRDKKVDVQRYKGLGEMNPEELWETTMNPETRKIVRVNLDDVVSAEEMVQLLMGHDSKERKKFIEENAENIDLEALTL
ncbi:MAG TPA: DNA gyrase subunit B [Spirochaetota bacterium]|nr:DNA gyrase subunit B [Spirochaetota bacterium]HOM38574.1 DNA gyrase subunit B [Spirochaetota bacterium]HPQ49711.1 DNA gyrase subunit B [Spirochaetota bacterium]